MRSSLSARAVYPLIFLHLALALPLAFFLNIWADEASTLYTTETGVRNAVQTAAFFERQAPLYFWVLSVWRYADHSIFFARLFSVICSAAAIWIFSRLAADHFEERPAFLATAFVALHPYLLWAGVEIRVYCLVVFLSALLIYLFLRGFENKLALLLFGAAALISIYTNYYLGFLLVGFGVALLTERRWKDLAAYVGVMAAVGLLLIPLMFSVVSQLEANTGGYHDPRSLAQGLRYLWSHFLTFILPLEIFPDQEQSSFEIARVWLARMGLAFVALVAIVWRERLSARTGKFMAIAGSVFCCLLAAYYVLGSTYVEIRHASVAFVPLICLAASFIDDIAHPLPERKAKWMLAAAGIIVMTAFTHAHLSLFPGMAKRGDWARVAEYIQANEAPNQPIAIFTVFDALALPYHYHGQNRIVPTEHVNDFAPEAEFGSTSSLNRETEFLLSQIGPDVDEFWLAVNEKCLVTEACVPLENYLLENYTIQKEQQFYREKVFLLRRKAR